MRFKSSSVQGFKVFAVTGTNTISFAIQATESAKKELLGFSVERIDKAENQRYFMYGFKVFPSVIGSPDAKTQVSTYDHPIQSFLWDDFTAKPEREYEYIFYPLRGEPKNIDRSALPIPVKVRTERLFGDDEHDIFFNRGVASSQAYNRKFNNKNPNKLPAEKKQEALDWLSRNLDDAILSFINNAKKNDTLLCCFYEFRYKPVADALKAAIDKGVNVKIIIDAKINESFDKEGNLIESFPREDNLETIKKSKIPKNNIILRTARKSYIQHNKFMVLLKGKASKPIEVWTGSTNLSEGGIHGQTNVGHWVKNEATAKSFYLYWELLSGDPGSQLEDSTSARSKNSQFLSDVAELCNIPESLDDIPVGITPVFSPTSTLKILDLYANLVDSAAESSHITLAFGVNKRFKDLLADNNASNHIVFLLLEKKDKAKTGDEESFVKINASNNAYTAWGSYLKDPIYRWAKETNAKILQLNKHVSYIHSKFLLVDPLSDDPIVVTGSANFSENSITKNDENMLIIRGNKRVADIYFTEFNRLFFHYYFRSVLEATSAFSDARPEGSLFLMETSKWTSKYKQGSFRQKRVQLLAGMKGTE